MPVALSDGIKGVHSTAVSYLKKFRSFRTIRTILSGGLLAAAAIVQAPDAAAHGGIWRAYDIYVEPGNPDHTIARSDVWGLFQSTDGGKTWHWICAEAYKGASLQTQKRAMALLPGGTLLVANQFDGLQVAPNGDMCNFSEADAFVDEVVQDVYSAADDGSLVYVLTSTGSSDGIAVKIWESTDQGGSWSQVGTSPPTDPPGQFSASSLRAAPSDPNRLYVAGKMLDDTSNAVVMSSDDGGATWQPMPITLNDSESFTARIYAVDPSDPDIVYFWKDRMEMSGDPPKPDQLWVTTDGGTNWAQAYESAGNLPGFDLDPAQGTLLISGPQEGVLEADISAGPPTDPSSFTQVYDGMVWGMAQVGDQLLAGTNDFAPGDAQKASLGMSMDRGASFEPVMNICQVSMIECPGDSLTGMVCPNLTGDFAKDFSNSPRCAGDAPAGGADAGGSSGGATGGAATGGANGGPVADGGTMSSGNTGGGGGGGGGCSVTAPKRVPWGSAGGWVVALGALGAAALRRRRRG